MDANAGPRLAFIHDWLNGMRGGEKCLEALCREFPSAPITTLLYKKGSVGSAIESHAIRASLLNRLPAVQRYYRLLLPLMPAAAGWRIADCDAVLSFSHCIAKSAVPPAGIPHICYCFTPMRYAWHMREEYFSGRGLKARAIDWILSRLREWDRRVSERVTHFLAISRTIQGRIWDCYRRESLVIYPPVDVDFYSPAPVRREDFYLVVSAFAPYKRVDLAIEACRKLGRRLVVIGSGQNAKRLSQIAGGSENIEFLGWQTNEVIRDHYRRCAALLFPGEEDFGIVPLEANACGAPVIAFGRGGARETIDGLDESERPTGLFFQERTVEGLIAAMEQFERVRELFTWQTARANALSFSTERFRREMRDYIQMVTGTGRSAERRAA